MNTQTLQQTRRQEQNARAATATDELKTLAKSLGRLQHVYVQFDRGSYGNSRPWKLDGAYGVRSYGTLEKLMESAKALIRAEGVRVAKINYLALSTGNRGNGTAILADETHVHFDFQLNEDRTGIYASLTRPGRNGHRLPAARQQALQKAIEAAVTEQDLQTALTVQKQNQDTQKAQDRLRTIAGIKASYAGPLYQALQELLEGGGGDTLHARALIAEIDAKLQKV